VTGSRGGPRGRPGEDLACRHLQARGYRIVERNWRCRSGEIDVVARDGAVTVFVEVKQRGSGSHGAGFEAVDWRKRQRIVRAARLYSLARGLEGQPLRFDVISIDPGEAGQPQLRHDRNAFDVEGC
jgi:putative endonuclease